MQAYNRRDEVAPLGSGQVEARLRADFEQVLAVQSRQASIQNIQGRLRVQYEGLIRALPCTPDGTNNLAERELRPMVLMRKRSNGSTTFAGMETSAVLGSVSVLQTLAKQDAPLLDTVRQTLQAGVQEHSSQYRHPVSADFS